MRLGARVPMAAMAAILSGALLMAAGSDAAAQNTVTPAPSAGATAPSSEGTTAAPEVVAAAKKDRHAGYYYPKDVTVEEYVARAKALPAMDRKARIDFTNQLNLQVLAKPYPPPFVLYAKGDAAEKAILVATTDDFVGSLYRMRAFLALMTTLARQTDLFKTYMVDDLFTFFDQLKLLGFEQLTVSDGKTYAHQIKLK
jgi:hypothetical protein